MEPLKLVALDIEDLDVLSANLQDAVLTVGDMAYLARQNRFAAICNRFDWQSALATVADGRRRGPYRRRRSALRFERVRAAKLQNIDPAAKDQVLELLAIQFEATRNGGGDEGGAGPEGDISLIFAGGGVVRLHVECIEAELRDLGPVWSTRSRPQHGDDGPIETTPPPESDQGK